MNIKRYIVSRVRNPLDAEDVTQQVFLEYYESRCKEDDIQNQKAYLLGAARIKVADYYRQKKEQPKFVPLMPELVDIRNNERIISDFDTKEITEDLQNIISKLPPKTREACKLVLLHNLSYEEAAKKAKCSIRVFYERYYKGLKIIKYIFNS